MNRRRAAFGGMILAAVLGLASCQPEPETPPVAPSTVDCPGGTTVYGMAGPACAKPTPDAGKACSAARDCTGFCLAETRTCSPLSPQFGCFEVVTGDGQTAGLCVD